MKTVSSEYVTSVVAGSTISKRVVETPELALTEFSVASLTAAKAEEEVVVEMIRTLIIVITAKDGTTNLGRRHNGTPAKLLRILSLKERFMSVLIIDSKSEALNSNSSC